MGKSGDFMLMGEFHNNLDLKGRIVIPSKLREVLGEKIILTRGLDKSLFLYSVETWNLLMEKMNSLPFTEKETRNFVRFMTSGAVALEFDKQGRIIIPSYLREFACLEKETVIIGALNRVEIWSNNNWNNFMLNNFESLSEISCNFFNSN